METIDSKNWKVVWIVEKYFNKEDITGCEPDEVVTAEDNLLLNSGITAMLDLLIGGGHYFPFNAANAFIWIGDNSTAADPTQTDMQASSNKQGVPMDASYPQLSGQTLSFKGTFGTGIANFAWNETGVSNGSVLNDSVKMLNRKVQTFGTKLLGSTWVMTVTLTIT